MNADSKEFLQRIVETPSPSGYEHHVQKLVRDRITPWSDEVRTDVMGNVFGIRNPAGSPRIMLAGHCDQIGIHEAGSFAINLAETCSRDNTVSVRVVNALS